MTAKSRARKLNQKRRNSDDDSYARKLRAASEGAKAAREQRGKLQGHRPTHVIIDEASVREVSLVPEGEGTGYIIEGSARTPEEQLLWDIFGKLGSEEGIRPEAASDGATASAPRGPSEVEGQSSSESGSEPQGRASAEEHWIYFEKEVNGLPEYIGKSTCFCDIRGNHWKELGEN